MMGGEEMFISLPELSEIKISAVGRAGNIDVYVDYNVLLEDCR
jgi:chemotaxis protein CheY-P-specific phosphatase CheC